MFEGKISILIKVKIIYEDERILAGAESLIGNKEHYFSTIEIRIYHGIQMSDIMIYTF
jgi:hypothetical protein